MSNENAQPSSFDDLISVKQAADIIGLTPRHVRLLLTRGTIWGVKMGRDWFTTEDVIRAYMVQDRRPGPKTGK
ncbi:hypothetical protein ACFLXI_03370 [Chloroflexota bacterium]